MRRQKWRVFRAVASTTIPLLISGFSSTPAAEVATTWLPGNGNWFGGTWSGATPNNNTPAGTTYNVFIDGGDAGVSSVNLNANATIDNLSISAGDTLSIANNASLTLQGSGVPGTLFNAGSINFTSSGNATQLQIDSDEIDLTGGGTITLSDNTANVIYGSNSLAELNNIDNTIRGLGQIGNNQMILVNSGTIEAFSASASGGRLYIDPSNNGGVLNSGYMRARQGATLRLDPGFYINTGTIEVAANAFVGGVLELNGVNMSGAGNIVNKAKGQINVVGSSTISGNVSNPAGGTINVGNNTNLSLTSGGAITNAGTIALNSSSGNYSQLIISGGDVTLSGGGTVTLAQDGNERSYIFGAVNTNRLTNQDNTITGIGHIGDNQMALTNNGVIEAYAAAADFHSLHIDPYDLTPVLNNGVMRARSGSILYLHTGIYGGSGVYENQNNAHIYLNGATVTGRLNNVLGGTIDMVGSGGGTLSGIVSNPAGATISVDNNVILTLTSSVSLTNAGTIALNSSSGNNSQLIISGGDVTLSGGGTVTLAQDGNERSYIYGAVNTNRLTNQDNTITGIGQLGNNQMALTNNGIIEAYSAAADFHSLHIDPYDLAPVLNNGVMRARSGSILYLHTGTYGGSGVYENQSNAHIYLNGATVTGRLNNVLGGTIDMVGSGGGTLSGIVSNPAGANISVDNNVNLTLTSSVSLTNAGTISLHSASGNNSQLIISGGDVTLSGGGTVTLAQDGNERSYIYGAVNTNRLTNQDNTITGIGQLGNNQMALTNNGIIEAYPAAASFNRLTIDPYDLAPVINNGIIRARPGSILRLQSGTFGGSGIYENDGNAILELNGAVITGKIDNTAGGTISILSGGGTLSGTLYNTGNSIVLNNSGGLYFNGGTISGGSITSSTGNALNIPANTTGNLDGVTLNADVSVTDASLNIYNGLNFFNRTITLNSANIPASLGLAPGSQSFSGTGTTVFAGTFDGQISTLSGGDGSLTIGSGVTIRTGGANGTIAMTGLVNNGTISAQTFSKSLTINSPNFTNNGTLQASNGGSLVLSNLPLNYSAGVLTGGHYYAFGGSTINFGPVTIQTNSADVRLDGSNSRFDAINSLTVNNGTFTVANGRSFNFVNPLTNNGTVNAASGGTIIIVGGTNNGTINGQTGGTIIFNGSFIHNPGSNLNGSGSVIFNGGTQTFNGTIVGDFDVTLAGASNFGSTSMSAVKQIDVQTSDILLTNGAKLIVGSTNFNGTLSFSGTNSPKIALLAGSTPAALVLGNGNVSITNATGTSQIITVGPGAKDGQLDLNGGMRDFKFIQPGAKMSITAQVINGGISTSGFGLLQLSNSNTYAGGTNIATGTLQASDTHALGTGPVTFQDGTLDLRSDGTITNFGNPISAAPTNSMFLHIDRVTNGSAGTFALGTATLGTNLTIGGNGTALLSSAILTGNTILENFVPLNFSGPISGPFGIIRGGSNNSTGTVILSGSTANTFAGSTTVNLGTLVLNKSGAVAIPHDLNINGGTVKLLQSNQIADIGVVSIALGATLDLGTFSDTIGGLVNNSTLAIPSTDLLRINGNYTNAGTIALDSAMIVDYSAGSDPIAAIRSQIQSGFANGSWNGPGINSPAAHSATASSHRVVGVAEASDLGITTTGTFMGQTIDNTTVLVRYTTLGDSNLDGTVNSGDFSRLAVNFGKSGGMTFSDGDYNYDGIVNALDFNALASSFGQTVGSDLPEASSLGVLVPEPASLIFCTFASLLGICFRSRRRVSTIRPF